MTASYSTMFEIISDYAGTGLLWMLLLIAVLCLWIKVDASCDRHMLVWYPLSVICIYFSPVWILYLSIRNDGAILYRLLWLIPISVVICYTMVEVIYLLPPKYRLVSFCGAIILIMLCGNYVYSNPGFSKAENKYHVSQDIVEMCDLIAVPGREIKAAFPKELVASVRQYDATIVLAYGRDSLLGGWIQNHNSVSWYLNSEVIDAKELCTALRESSTAYVVIPGDKVLKGSLADYDFYYVTSVGQYDVYLDDHAYIGMWGIEYNK